MKPSLRSVLLSMQSVRIESWLIALAALAVAAASVFTYLDIVDDRDLTRATLFRVGDSLATTIEEQLNGTLRQGHNAAQAAAALIEHAGGPGGMDAARLHRELKRELADSTSVARLIVTDASGRVVASSAEDPPPALSIADTENFRWHQAHPTESAMHLGVGRTSPGGRPGDIPYSRAITGAEGKLAGVVVAEIAIGHMVDFYTRLTKNFPATISVLNRQGIQLITYIDGVVFAGRPADPKVPLDMIFQGNGELEFTARGSGRLYLYSYHVLKRHSVLVAIGFDKESAMAAWAARSRQRAAVVGTGSALFLALAGLLVGYLRKLRRSEEQLRNNDVQLRTIADNLPDGFVFQLESDREGRTRGLYLSAGVERLTGFSAESVLNDSTLLFRRIIEEDRPRVRAAAQMSAVSMKTYDVVARQRRQDGELRWMHIFAAPRRSQDGGILWDGIQLDITERKKSEDAARIRQAKIESIFRSAPVGIAEIVNRVFTTVNDRFCEILGYAAEELLGRSTRVLYRSDQAWEETGKRYDAKARGTGTITLEESYRRKDGRMIDVLVCASSIVYGDPNAGVTFTVMDITEAKAARRSLEDAYAKLKALSGMLINAQEAERRTISSELHDEIGQSLTAVKLQLHRLGKRLANGSATPEDVASSLEIADIALAQVRDMSVNLRPPQLELLGLETALQWLLQRQADAAGLKVHFSASLNGVERDAQAEITCFRVVQEALTNVIRHARANNLWVDVANRGRSIELRIKDDGIGFDVQAAKARAATGGSIGLLSMEERVTLLGGSFEIASGENAGTQIGAGIPFGFEPSARAAAGVGTWP